MNKSKFLTLLKSELNEKGFSKNEANEILTDYESMISEAVTNGEMESEYIASLGTIKSIVSQIPMREKTLKNQRDKWIALSPFIATILFFVVGFLLEGFAYSWLFFLLIPMSAIGLSTKGAERLVALSPFVFTITFFILGFAFNLWTVAWVGYTLIFPLAILAENRPFKYLMFALGLIIPGLYVVLYLQDPNPFYNLIFLGFVPLILYQSWPKIKAMNVKKFALGAAFTLSLTGIYLAIGFTTGAWHPAWLLFLLIPVSVLLYSQFIDKEEVPFVSYTPFISVILFILMGEVFRIYEIAWLVFLLIPIAGVLSNQED